MTDAAARFFCSEAATPLGKLLLLSDGERLCGAFFEEQKFLPRIAACSRERRDSLAIFRDARAWLERFFASAGRRAFPHEIPLAPAGTPFRLRVWRALCKIPAGTTASYAELASMLEESAPANANSVSAEARKSARAVASALAHNPLIIFIPCHRVIAADGKISGFSGGVERKIFLLKLEGARFRVPANFHSPAG